jgi:hypothetical protein
MDAALGSAGVISVWCARTLARGLPDLVASSFLLSSGWHGYADWNSFRCARAGVTDFARRIGSITPSFAARDAQVAQLQKRAKSAATWHCRLLILLLPKRWAFHYAGTRQRDLLAGRTTRCRASAAAVGRCLSER